MKHSPDLCSNWNAASKATRGPLPIDASGNPIQTGTTYRITIGDHSFNGFVYYTEDTEFLFVCDIAKRPGEVGRTMNVNDLPLDATWVMVNGDGSDIKQPLAIVETIQEKLCAIESRRVLLKSEIKRLERVACDVVGCRPHDGSDRYDLVFDFIHNDKPLDAVLKIIETRFKKAS